MLIVPVTIYTEMLRNKFTKDKWTRFETFLTRSNVTVANTGGTDAEGIQEDMDRVFRLFPVLKERVKQPGGTLSGGEQQMLAIGRALMAHPKVMLMDEPSMGLAPMLVEAIFQTIRDLNEQGTTILLVEQNALAALSVADRGYVMETGILTLTGTGQELLNDPRVKAAYLGEE